VVDDEVRRITDECYSDARKLIQSNRGKLDAIANHLLAHETLDEAEIYASAGVERPPVTHEPPPLLPPRA